MARFSNKRSKQRSGFGRYPLENVALALLMAHPQHGYGLHQQFEEDFELIWKAGQTKLYIVLSDLEEAGYLDGKTAPQEKGPDRKVYTITEPGREAVLEWLHAPVTSMQAIRVEFIAKLRLFNILQLPGAADLIDRQIAVIEAMLDEWEAETAGEESFLQVVYGYRQHQALSILHWLHDCKTAYRQYFTTEQQPTQ